MQIAKNSSKNLAGTLLGSTFAINAVGVHLIAYNLADSTVFMMSLLNHSKIPVDLVMLVTLFLANLLIWNKFRAEMQR